MAPLDPPEDFITHETPEEAIEALQQWAHDHGYAVYKRRSKKKQGSLYKIWVDCDRGGIHTSHGASRKTSTKKTNCPFSVHLVRQKRDGNVVWKRHVMLPDHNHEASIAPIAHTSYRKRTDEALKLIETMTLSGSKARDVLTACRQHGHTVSARDIYNERYNVWSRKLNGMTPIQALLHELEHHGLQEDGTIDEAKSYAYWYTTDEQSRLQNLFFAHPTAMKLLKLNPDVLLLDTTYKTNRFNMPLFRMVGSTSVGTTFDIAFAFVPNESIETYTWCVDCLVELLELCQVTEHVKCLVTDQEDNLKKPLSEALPQAAQILCQWHVCNNVLTKAQKTWQTKPGASKDEKRKDRHHREDFMAAFRSVMYTPRALDLDKAWSELLSTYEAQPGLHDYLRKQKWPRRFEWANCWVGTKPHFGNTTTSPIEGSHSGLKAYLGTSSHHLKGVLNEIERMTENKLAKLIDQLSIQHQRLKHHLRHEHLLELHGKVTEKAIQLAFEQLQLVEKNEAKGPCQGRFSTSMGIPCCHTIRRRLRASEKPLQLDDFHPHWHYNRPGTEGLKSILNAATRDIINVADPPVQTTRGRPRVDRTTRRIPSMWEPQARRDESAAMATTTPSVQTRSRSRSMASPTISRERAPVRSPRRQRPRKRVRFLIDDDEDESDVIEVASGPSGTRRSPRKRQRTTRARQADEGSV